jgi:predicted glycogen debranching enzyme
VISFGADVCRDWPRATSKEWLETNGLGGYASSTIVGANTRRYHGLLVAALSPPTHRTLLLSKLEETLALADTEYDLSCNQYPGAIYPEGYRYLREFRLDPFPTFLYEVDGSAPVQLEKTVAMCHGLNAVVVRYRLIRGAGTASLVVRPLINSRDHHHLMREGSDFDTSVTVSGARDRITARPYPTVPPLHIHLQGAYFEPWGYWYHNFEYAQEAVRGLDWREDQYSPGYFVCQLEAGETRFLVASADSPAMLDPGELLDREHRRRASLTARRSHFPIQVRELAAATDTFLVSRSTHSGQANPRGVIAGYHWFEEWGRDAMISLPGLALVTGRYDVAREVLLAYAEHRNEGLIPNRIPEVSAHPDYNTVDATLWLFWAVQKYLEYTADEKFVAEFLPVLVDAVNCHARGTRYGIEVDSDGLLRAGAADTQLTWMDAKVGDWVVTPRHGKPVEVNALWYNALRFVEELGAEHLGPKPEEVAQRFGLRFWCEERGHLNDVVDGDVPADASLRPNQILAVSLPYPAIEGQRARAVVEAVERDLLTPYGLRTLSPHDARYRARYGGDQWERDGAYHQGTVWPWLLGPFITAYVRTADDKDAARATARGWLRAFDGHMQEAGLGHVSEIFDGDEPHEPRGCIAQAWSVAEILRAAVEDVGLPGMGR